MLIPCETIVRASYIVKKPHEDIDDIFGTIRLENGKLIATNRKFMVVEQITAFEGTYHVRIDDKLLKQCEEAVSYSGMLEIIPNPALQFTTAKTTMGYTAEGNIGVFPQVHNFFDDWHKIVEKCSEPLTESSGAMVWNTADVHQLCMASPSGTICFEKYFNVTGDRPCVVRDISTGDWCGFFVPRIKDGVLHNPAIVPGWLK